MLKEQFIKALLLITEAKKKKGDANTWGLSKSDAGKLHEVLLGGFVNHYAKEYQKHKGKGDKAAHETAMKSIDKIKTKEHVESLSHMSKFSDEKTKQSPKEMHDSITKKSKAEDYENHVHHAKRAAKEFISHLRSNGVKDLKAVHMTANKKDIEKLTGGKDSSDRGNNSDIVVEHGHKNKGGGFHGLSVKSGANTKLNNPGMGKVSKLVDEYHLKITGKKGSFSEHAEKHEKAAQENHHKIVNKHAKLIKKHAAQLGKKESDHITKQGSQHYLSHEGLRAVRKSNDDKVKSVYKEMGDSRLKLAKQPIGKSLRDHVSRMMSTQGKHKEKKEFIDKLSNLERPEGSMPVAKINTKNEKASVSYSKDEFENHHKNSGGKYSVGGGGIETNIKNGKGMHISVVVDSSPSHGATPVARNGLHVWDKSTKSEEPRKKKKKTVNEDAPVNVVGGGMSPVIGGEGNIQGYDPIMIKAALRRRRLKEKLKESKDKFVKQKSVTTKPNGNGYHNVYVDGELQPDYEVVNGAGGNASMGKQTYGIRKGDKVQWVGCLKDTRKRLNKMLGESETIAGDHPVIQKFASIQHDNWRKGFDPEGSGKERVKKNSDGTEGNINVPFDKLHPDWQKENLAAGRAAHDAVQKHPNDLEKAAEHVHNEWMKRNPKADYNAHQHVAYDELPENEKEKDREHVRTMHNLLGADKKAIAESGPLSGKPKKLKPLTPKKLEPLKYRLERINKRGAGSPGAVKIKDWLADKKRRKEEYKKEREERMKNRERRDENT